MIVLRTPNPDGLRTVKPTPVQVFLKMAQDLAELSTCPDDARHGAIIVVDRRIVATGYGSPASGKPVCSECWLRKKFAETGVKDWSVCPSVHAELNSLLFAARHGVSVLGGTLYITKNPCESCRRALLNAGIIEIVTTAGHETLTTKKR